MESSPAVLAGEKSGPSLYREKRDKEEAQVMIDALEVQTHPPAGRTGPNLLVHIYGFGLHATDEEKHLNLPWIIQ